MTNGDRIRQMTDEEFARIEHFCPYDHECSHIIHVSGDYHVCSDGVSCEECKLEWLKEEAENEPSRTETG